MAADNKLLGDFELGGIPMAPRGHPQIEVTFDIDASGIMNVSAKDKSTGKATSVTIKSSGGLSDSEIETMINEAEAAKDDDAKRKDAIEVKNEADSMIYQTEKQLEEHGDKIPDEVVDQVKGDIEDLQKEMATDEPDAIREALEKVKNSAMEIGKAIYSQNDGS